MKLSYLQWLFGYNEWANNRMFECLAQINDEQFTRDLYGEGSAIRDTLAHIVGVEWLWLERWQGRIPGIPDWIKDPSRDTFKNKLQEVETAREIYLKSLNDADLERVLDYKNIKGENHSKPLHLVLVHLINHSSYHRGQFMTKLRQLGGTPISTDLVLFA